MIHKVRIFTILSLVLVIMMSSSVSLNLGLAQTSDITKANSTMNPETEALLKKIFKYIFIFQHSNNKILLMELRFQGVSLGDSTVEIMVRKIATENATNLSTPVTVTAVRVPGSSIKDLMALVEASPKPSWGRKHWSSSSNVNTDDGRIMGFVNMVQMLQILWLHYRLLCRLAKIRKWALPIS